MAEGGGWVRVEDLIKEFRTDDPAYNAAIVGLDGVPDPKKRPMEAYRYTVKRRQTIVNSWKQRSMIRVWDGSMNYIGRITAERNVDWQELMYSAGSGRVVVARDNWLIDFLIKDIRAEEDLHITIDPRPTKRTWEHRWGGKVTAAHIKRTAEGVHEVELELISNWEHWNHIIFAANPVTAPEVQIPKIYILPMNTRSAISITGTLNLMRQYNPALGVFTNLLNPGHWAVPLVDPNIKGALSFNPLSWPVQMEYINPIIDQSRFTFIAARWTMAATATDPLLKDAGCFMKAITWLEEDKTSPHRELADLVGERAARPTRNCVVMRCLNKSRVSGPSGTLIDGIVDLVAATADDMLTEVIFPVDSDHDGVTDPLFRKWLGVAPAKPKVVFRDGEFSGIIDSDRIQFKAKARTIATGGKSPGIINQAQTWAIRYGLSQLGQTISYGLGAYATPGAEGLDNLYQGQLDNTLFAFQKYTDPKRVLRMGAHAFLEHIEQGSGTAWTVSGQVTLRIGSWKTRAHTACKVSVMNGYPHLLYEDYELGDGLGFELADVIFTDQLGGTKGSYSTSEPLKYELSIGTDQDEEDPFARGLRAIQAVWGIVGMVLGDGGGL